MTPAGAATRPELLFDREHWRRQGRLQELHGGRGGIAILGHGRGDLALRHYRRGGWAARLSADRYLYTGEPCVRSFRELRLHALLVERGLPVPVPVAALYRRRAAAYEADLITVMIPDAQSLASRLVAGTVRCRPGSPSAPACGAFIEQGSITRTSMRTTSWWPRAMRSTSWISTGAGCAARERGSAAICAACSARCSR